MGKTLFLTVKGQKQGEAICLHGECNLEQQSSSIHHHISSQKYLLNMHPQYMYVFFNKLFTMLLY